MQLLIKRSITKKCIRFLLFLMQVFFAIEFFKCKENSSLELSTLLGGSGEDRIHDIVWTEDIIYFVGSSSSNNLRTNVSGNFS